MLRCAAFKRAFDGALPWPMPLFRCLVPPLLFLLIGAAHAQLVGGAGYLWADDH